jgi:hypothetical protein
MGFPTSEVGYTSATTGRGDHEVHKGHVVALKKILSDIPVLDRKDRSAMCAVWNGSELHLRDAQFHYLRKQLLA